MQSKRTKYRPGVPVAPPGLDIVYMHDDLTNGYYFVFARDNSILKIFTDFSDARYALHELPNAQYMTRGDGVVLAYMSNNTYTWRAIHRVSPEIRKSMSDYMKAKATTSGQ